MVWHTLRHVRSVVIAPSLIYGRGHGLNSHSIQVPWLIQVAKKFGVAKHIGPGETAGPTYTSTTDGIVRAGDREGTGRRVYYAENGENSMREVCEAISRMLAQGGRTQSMTVEEATTEWGEGAATIPWAPTAACAPSARGELK